jgi:hypothetical protein
MAVLQFVLLSFPSMITCSSFPLYIREGRSVSPWSGIYWSLVKLLLNESGSNLLCWAWDRSAPRCVSNRCASPVVVWFHKPFSVTDAIISRSLSLSLSLSFVLPAETKTAATTPAPIMHHSSCYVARQHAFGLSSPRQKCLRRRRGRRFEKRLQFCVQDVRIDAPFLIDPFPGQVHFCHCCG